jgi:TRAP-type transport system periplasmic protein
MWSSEITLTEEAIMRTRASGRMIVKRMRCGKSLIGFLLTALFLLAPCLTWSAESAKPVTLVFASHWAPQLAPYQVIDRWFKKLEGMSNGQLQVKRYPGGTLSAINTALQDLRTGTTDFQSVSVHIFTAEFPVVHAMQYFFYDYPNMTVPYEVFWETYHQFPEIQAAFKKQGLLPLCTIVPGAVQLHARKAIRRLADLKNLQVGIGGAYLIPVVKELGGMPSNISYLEFYQALQKGIITACTFNNEFLKVAKLAEVTKYSTSLGGSYDACGGIFCVREETWNKLPPDLQKLFKETLKDFQLDYIRTIETINEDAKKSTAQGGHEFIEWPAEDMAKWYAACEKVARSEAAQLDKQGNPLTKIFEFTRTMKLKYEPKGGK